MKKVLSAILTLTLLLTLSTAVFADFRYSPDNTKVEAAIEVAEDGTEYFGAVVSATEPDAEPVKLIASEVLLFDVSTDTEETFDHLTVEHKEILVAADKKLDEAHEELDEAESMLEVFGTEVLDAEKTYAVTKLFDVTPIGTVAEQVDEIFEEKGALVMTFKIDVPKDRNFHIATLCEDEWLVLKDEQVEVLENGLVSVTFYELCPIAIIEEIVPTAGDVVTSPQTSAPNLFYGAMAGVALLLSAACFGSAVVLKKSRMGA